MGGPWRVEEKKIKICSAVLVVLIVTLFTFNSYLNYKNVKRMQEKIVVQNALIQQKNASIKELADNQLSESVKPEASPSTVGVFTVYLEKDLSPKGDDKVTATSEKLSTGLWQVTLNNKAATTSNAIVTVISGTVPFEGEPVVILGSESVSELKKVSINKYRILLKDLPSGKPAVIDFIVTEAAPAQK